MKPEAIVKLKPCPLCGESDLWYKEFGIECRNCGLWLGDGSKVKALGGYVKVWNRRPNEK